MKPIKRINIEVIPHLTQRYETAGDWWVDNKNTLQIRASKLDETIDPNNFMSLSVAFHELAEALGCFANGIPQEAVDAFDLKWKGKGEPGDSPDSPYHRYHNFASACEGILIGAMNICWGTYEKAIDKLVWRKK